MFYKFNAAAAPNLVAEIELRWCDLFWVDHGFYVARSSADGLRLLCSPVLHMPVEAAVERLGPA